MLSGGLDLIDRHGLQGWVRQLDEPDAPVSLLIKIDGAVKARILANYHRVDLEEAGIGDGRFGFALKLEDVSAFEPHTVEIVREADGSPLPGTPRLIPAAPELTDALQDHLVELLSHADSAPDLIHWATFLANQADRMLQRRADIVSDKPHRTAPREFRVRWTGQGPAPDADPAPRALIIDDRLPVANRDAGSQAILSHIRSLQRLGFNVTVAPSDMRGGDAVSSLQADGVTCCSLPWCASVEEVLRRENSGYALVYVHRVANTRYLSLIRHHQPRARIVYNVADLHHLRLARQAEVEERPELLEVSRRTRAVELGAARFVDSVITHSSFERDVIVKELPQARVHVVPWAVQPRPVQTSWDARRGLAFVGSYDHPPNLDAAWWLIQDVMPLVRAGNPAIECYLAGSGMPDALMAAVSPGIRPLGYISDLSGLFETVRLTVAPLNYGAGLKGKVLDSLAAGLPCACTPVAAEGTGFPAILQAMVGETAAALAAIILRLHDDPFFNADCSAAGLAYVTATLSDAQVDSALREAVGMRAA